MFKYAYPHSTGRSFRRTLGSKTPATDSLSDPPTRSAQFVRPASVEPDFLFRLRTVRPAVNLPAQAGWLDRLPVISESNIARPTRSPPSGAPASPSSSCVLDRP